MDILLQANTFHQFHTDIPDLRVHQFGLIKRTSSSLYYLQIEFIHPELTEKLGNSDQYFMMQFLAKFSEIYPNCYGLRQGN